ncbi:MAG: hydrogenase maturation nickel metallochaperone HypA [Proteobacteria bacterium]|jgi:hydrogenase nickel incorporation protein HypA/HybF|nr:hydrogenase maturation nickel metallochaperone HypA [Alphaproteobacteria bacterium]NCC03082.1 hydrogenase maturation nickel metallochaperone HypA [Pseudomonadota bacterium]
MRAMHELSLCENIVKIIERQAARDGFTRVVTVTLSLGDLSGASEESLSFCFPMVTKGTVADGATLAFVHTSGCDLRVKEVEVGD